MQPADYLRTLQRRWVVVLLAPLLAMATAFLLTPSGDADEPQVEPDTVFTATHTLLREATDSSRTTVSIPRLQLFATTGEVPQRVVQRLGLDEDPAVVASTVLVTGDDDVGTLTFTVEDPDGERAALLANAFADEVLAYFNERVEAERQIELEQVSTNIDVQEQRIIDLDQRLRVLPEEDVEASLLRSERDALIRQYGATYDRYQTLQSEVNRGIGYVTLQEATPVPISVGGVFQAPSGKGPRMAMGGGLGLVLGLALALVLDRMDTRVRTRRGAEHAFRLPVVAEIPRPARAMRQRGAIATYEAPASAIAEAYRILRLSLQLMPRWALFPDAPGFDDADAAGRPSPQDPREEAGPRRVLLVTSAGPGEGKTTTVANLAACYAEGGRTVLLIDCDSRGGDLHRYFGLDKAFGLHDFLVDPSARLEDFAKETHLRGVRIITRGDSEDPSQLLGAGGRLREQSLALADVVILDAGPLLSINDPAALIPNVDAVVVVSRSGRTSAEGARYTTELLARVKAPVIGVALTAVTRSTSGTYSVSRPSSVDRMSRTDRLEHDWTGDGGVPPGSTRP